MKYFNLSWKHLLLGLYFIAASSTTTLAAEKPIFLYDQSYPIRQNNTILDSNDDGGDVSIQFGRTLNKQLYWDDTNSIFTFSDALQVQGKSGIGIYPTSTFHIYENTPDVGINTGATIENQGIGDAILQFLVTSVQRWVVGIDNSDGQKFKIASGIDVGTNTRFTIDTSGNVGIGNSNPTSQLDITPSTNAAIGIAPYGTTAGNTGELHFRELIANGTNYVGWKAPDNISTNRIWTLPSSDGTNGQALVTNGSGVLSWSSPSAGGAAGSNGQVQFNNSGTFGASANLFWNNANAQLGIGTSTTSAPLTIRRSTAGQAIAIRNTGDTATTSYITDDGRINLGGGNITGANRFQVNSSPSTTASYNTSIFELNSEDGGTSDFQFRLSQSQAGSYPALLLSKSRGTLSAPTAVIDNDSIGGILGTAYVGASGGWRMGAQILFKVNGTPSDGADIPTSMELQTTADGSGTPTTRLSIASTGNVGIGTTGPSNNSTNLHVYETNTDTVPAFLIEQASTGNAAQRYLLTGGQNISVGIHNADNDNYKITNTTSLTGTTYDDANTMMRIHTESGSEGIIDLNHQSRVRAYRNSSTQSIPNNTWTKIQFNAENFDEQSEFDSATNYRFIAKEDGYYQVNARTRFTINGASSLDYLSIAIYVNGIVYSYGNNLAVGGSSNTYDIYSNNAPNVSDMVYLNAGQYIEIFTFQDSGAARVINPNSEETYVSIHKLS